MSATKEYDFKKSKIINCAEKLFVSQGYDLTTVNDILKEVGIAKGTFYYYFESKEEVMDAVIMKHIGEILESVHLTLRRNDIGALQKLVLCLFSKPSTNRQKVLISKLCTVDNALMKQRTLQRTIEILCPIFALIIHEGNLNNEFSSLYPLADVQFLLAGFQTLFDLSKINGSTISVEVETVASTLIRILNINKKISRIDVLKMIEESISAT